MENRKPPNKHSDSSDEDANENHAQETTTVEIHANLNKSWNDMMEEEELNNSTPTNRPTTNSSDTFLTQVSILNNGKKIVSRPLNFSNNTSKNPAINTALNEITVVPQAPEPMETIDTSPSENFTFPKKTTVYQQLIKLRKQNEEIQLSNKYDSLTECTEKDEPKITLKNRKKIIFGPINTVSTSDEEEIVEMTAAKKTQQIEQKNSKELRKISQNLFLR